MKEYGFSWYASGELIGQVWAWHKTEDRAKAGVRAVAREGYGTSVLYERPLIAPLHHH